MGRKKQIDTSMYFCPYPDCSNHGKMGPDNQIIGAGVRDSVKVMIGGAPITQAYADEIGANGYAPDAASAVELARSLMG